MVHRQDQMVDVAGADDVGADRQFRVQREGTRALLGEYTLQTGRRALGRPDHRTGPLDRQHHLRRLVVALREHGAQHLVPGQHVGEGRGEGVEIGRTRQTGYQRNVVGRRRPVQLVQEPQPALRVRQRQRVGPLGHLGDPRSGSAGQSG
ncbi:hypothetical protein GA0115252_15681, partial [Streptomyces sp. DfronAA-171]